MRLPSSEFDSSAMGAMTAIDAPHLSVEENSALDELYAALAAAHLSPLWTQRAGLMPQPSRTRCLCLADEIL